MSRAGHIFAEQGRNLSRHLASSLGSFLSLTLMLLLFDLFWIAAGTSEKFYSDLISEIRIEAYIAENVPDSSLQAIQRSLRNVAGVAESRLITREAARAELTRLVGTDLLIGYDSTNPLPRSFVITVEPDYLTSEATAAIKSDLLSINGVASVDYSRGWLQKAEGARALVLQVGMILGGLILLTVLITSANSIRLMTEVRAVGLHQMRLLGAGRLFLAMPYLLESLIISVLAAVAGWVVILYFRNEVSFTGFELVLPRLSDIVLFVIASALLGFVSGYLGIRRLLK